MQHRLDYVLIGHLEVNSVDVRLEAAEDSLELVLVEKGEVFEGNCDVVQFVGHQGVYDAGQDVLLLQDHLLGLGVLLPPAVYVDLDLGN